MKASINRDGCIACGLCESTCPQVFRMADDGLAEVYTDPVPASEEESATKREIIVLFLLFQSNSCRSARLNW